MTFLLPMLLVVAAVAIAGLIAAYIVLQRRRTAVLAAVGRGTQGSTLRRHLPYALFLAALALLLVSLARPQATLPTERAAGTVILAFDVSNSMGADDVDPSRLAAAQAAATNFVRAQPASVDIGVVAFGQGALVTQAPTENHEEAIAAIGRLSPAGGTSLGAAIATALSTIVGHPVVIPEDPDAPPPADLGYWGSATIVLLSDGEDTGSNALAAAELAADAGVHIQAIGVGTPAGAVIEVDGFQVATALDAELLTTIAEITNGAYRGAADAAALDDVYASIDLRTTVTEEPVELTGYAVGGAILLLTAGGVLMVLWSGRIV